MGYEAFKGLRPAPEFSRRIADIMRIKDEPARIGTKIIDPAGLARSPVVWLSYFHCLQKGKINHAAIDAIAAAATSCKTVGKKPSRHDGRSAIGIGKAARFDTIRLECIEIGRVAIKVSRYFLRTDVRHIEVAIGMAAQFMPTLNQLPAALLRNQVSFGFFRANQIPCDIECTANAILLQNGSPGALRRVRHIVKRKSNDPFILRQTARSQWKATADTVVQPCDIPFQATACPFKTVHVRHCTAFPKAISEPVQNRHPGLQTAFFNSDSQTSLALACKRNPKMATMIQNQTAPPF